MSNPRLATTKQVEANLHPKALPKFQIRKLNKWPQILKLLSAGILCYIGSNSGNMCQALEADKCWTGPEPLKGSVIRTHRSRTRAPVPHQQQQDS